MSSSDTRSRGAPALVLLVVVIAALLAWIAWQQGFFSRSDKLFVEASDAAGMSEGMPVSSHGVMIGSVRAIALPAPQSTGQPVRIELAIGRDYMGQIAKGTQARVVRAYLLGSPTLELVAPPGGGQPVAAGEVLAFAPARDDGHLVQDVQAALLPVIGEARKLTQSLSDPEGPFQQTLKAGQDMAARMPALTEKTGQVIEQTQQAVRTIETGAAATLQKASHTIGVVEQAAPEVIAKVQQAVAASQKTSAEVQAMAAQANERLPAVLDQVQAAATQTNQMVSSARQTWPISMLTGTPTTPQSLPIDSIGGLPLPQEKP